MAELLESSRRWLERNPYKWQSWLIVSSVLLLTPAVAYFISPDDELLQLTLVLLLGGIGALFAVRFLVRWPALGLILLIPTNMLVPFSIGTGTGSQLNATILLLGFLAFLWLFTMIGEKGTIRLIDSGSIRPLLLLVLVAFLSFIVGQLPWFLTSGASLPAQIGGLMVFVLSALGFLLPAHQIQDLRWLRWLTWTFVAIGALYVAGRLIPGFHRTLNRIFVWGGTSSQFWTWFIAIVFGQALLNRKLRPRWRIVLGAIFVCAVYVAFVQANEWKSGWVPSMVAVAVIVGLRSWYLGALVGVASLVVAPELLSRLIVAEQYSFSTRIDAWLILLDIARANPILGFGPANYYFYTPLYTIRGYYSLSFNSHNQYVDLLLQTGILGLLCYLWFFGRVAHIGWRLRKRVPGEGFAEAYVYGVLGGLVATLVAGMLGDWVLPFIYNVSLVGLRSSILGWVFLGGLVALAQILGEEDVNV